ncbi:MAG: hypothetical protein M1541_07290 [Acidobacteria bacterium]|nr:hypothetical protein [Acidobacteriota bacterium]
MTVRFLLLALCTALAGSGETRQQRGKQVVDQALAALGGERFLAMRDRVESGRAYSFYREKLSGLARAKVYTRYLTRPEPPQLGFFGVRERQNFGKKEEYGVLFAEGKGYDITFRGARPIGEDVVARYIETTRRNVFYILRMRLGEPGLTFEWQGSEVYDNQPVEVVDITDAGNLTTTVYFNQTTKLPIRQVFYRRDNKTRERFEEVTLFSKYRDVGGGVQWPFAIQRFRDGEKIYEMYSDSVTINQDLTDNMFTISGDMKILKPAH